MQNQRFWDSCTGCTAYPEKCNHEKLVFMNGRIRIDFESKWLGPPATMTATGTGRKGQSALSLWQIQRQKSVEALNLGLGEAIYSVTNSEVKANRCPILDPIYGFKGFTF
jgi:hypothetical protein